MLPSLDYAVPGTLTTLAAVDPVALEGIGTDPVEACRLVTSLVIQPDHARTLSLTPDRFATNQIRSAAELVRQLLALDPAPVTVRRTPELRIVGTCRHFAVLSCALLRHRGVASRVRCGFATYFQPGQGLDHWVTEFWDHDQARWDFSGTATGGATHTHHQGLSGSTPRCSAWLWCRPRLTYVQESS
jgi:hypothetical protein